MLMMHILWKKTVSFSLAWGSTGGSIYYNLYATPLMEIELCKVLVLGFVMSHIHYANSLLYRLLKKYIDTMQKGTLEST